MCFYFAVNTEWLSPYIDGNPTQVYFCQSKLDVWANTAGQAKEALRTCKELLTPFFDKTHKDIVSQLTGKKCILTILTCKKFYIDTNNCH